MTPGKLLPRRGEAAGLLVVLTLLALEGLALCEASDPDRPVIGAALIGAAASGLLLVAALLVGRRLAARRGLPLPPPGPDGPVYSTRALEGFPMEAVRPLLLTEDGPQLNQLYAAWVLALGGHTAPWIGRRLDLPVPTVRLLVDAVREQRRGAHRLNPDSSPPRRR
ncbi:hypothetical protein PUR71_26625 [Streptomyces sp. SP17BM10]|uniref:hypothetical protein n=1 Tax=Streptomyces sp. SP17BM10 TaxID=3002530 RepID=UPI002E761C94|nr:hypothetical protein [Streptomyces sp. SP17BM10]MEE1786452.1 hypothetical protein [Streptomyces sp. SP17BM10]